VRTSFKAVALVGIFAALAFAAAGCGGGGKESSGTTTGTAGGGNVTALPASSCSSIYYEGSGQPDFIIASDLPLQGAGRAQTTEMVEAIKFALKSRNFEAGGKQIGYQSCDDSTAQAGAWDSAKCASNARAYAGNKSVIGVVGTFNSGCAKIIVPVLNRANPGPMPMVSPANTSPGLTTDGPGAEPGEPDKYLSLITHLTLPTILLV
jgi:branched-chain amino acid transport system substrate-binding protein